MRHTDKQGMLQHEMTEEHANLLFQWCLSRGKNEFFFFIFPAMQCVTHRANVKKCHFTTSGLLTNQSKAFFRRTLRLTLFH